METNFGHLAVYSIYITPGNTNINNAIFDFIISSHTNWIILGDLNAKSKAWYCNSENKRGLDLEALSSINHFHILNNKTPTYKRSNSILDLTIYSNQLYGYFKKI